jgi:2-polyprenyl-3-methyl-5-hydroxy-6-metoxy-1,4-benzoquinol methylase
VLPIIGGRVLRRDISVRVEQESESVPHVCPWWGGYFIDNGLRRWLHNPERILSPYVEPGMKILDFGCGMGIFSIAMARLAGAEGCVTAVDLQQRMLDVLSRRAASAGVSERIRTHPCSAESLDLQGAFDFALAFYSAHEVPDVRRLLVQLHGVLRVSARLLVVEPIGHVPRRQFALMMDTAQEVGFRQGEGPRVRLSRAAVLTRK